MLSTVLIVLTVGHADPPHVSFSTAADQPACAAKAERLTAILEGAGYRIAASRCIDTAQAFSPYDHAADRFPYVYRLTLPADPAKPGRIEPLDRLASCAPAPEADPAIWCAVSAQAPAASQP